MSTNASSVLHVEQRNLNIQYTKVNSIFWK